MIRFHLVTRIVAALAAVAVAGCSGGGGGGSTSGPLPLPQTGALAVGAAQRSVSSIAFQPSAVRYKSLYSFTSGSDGRNPYAGLLNVNGTLYGTTVYGGNGGNCSHSCGTVFKITTSGKESVLYSFNGSPDGANPSAGLLDVNGTLYGTTSGGGASGGGCYRFGGDGCGTVFSIPVTGGPETVLYRFTSGSDGRNPHAGLLNVNGTLYGTTTGGGTSDNGTVFSITPSGKESVVYRFQGGTDGRGPGGLLNVNATLYGTTTGGGTSNNGTVFSIAVTGGPETELYRFTGGSDGSLPVGSLINVKGTLYGTTELSGSSNLGTVFSIPVTGGTETALYGFKGGQDGSYPAAGLLNVNGTLYGTTQVGGTSNYGTVFKMSTTGNETVLYRFQGAPSGGPDGAFPYAGLINVNGTLYGATYYGGTSGYGTVFSISL